MNGVPTTAIILAFIALAAPAFSENARSAVDLRDADIEGFRLGMSYKEAVEVFAQRYGQTWEKVDAEVTKSENTLLGTDQAQWIAMTNGSETLSVNFATRIPLNPDNPLVVDTITYQLPWSPRNEADLAKANIAQYGRQSNAPATDPMQWCPEPQIESEEICPVVGRHLLLSGTKLQLVDFTFGKAELEFIDTSQTSKPTF